MMLEGALGCFYGQCVGDALGSRYEFKAAAETIDKLRQDADSTGHVPMLGGGPFHFGAGVVTDDSEMALSLLGSLGTLHSFDAAHVACSYARWCRTNPPDIGQTCLQALSVQGCNEELSSPQWPSLLTPDRRLSVLSEIHSRVRSLNAASCSNGALMRQSVLASFFAKDERPDRLLAAVAADTSLTHVYADAVAFSSAYALGLFLAIRGQRSPREIVDECIEKSSSEQVRGILAASRFAPVPVRLSNGQFTSGDAKAIGYAGVALQSAFHSLQHARSFESGVLGAIARGGDTDTNAAITSALLGAHFGVDAIPKDWLEAVKTAEIRLRGENGIESMEQMETVIRRQYE